jgi:tRNA(Ile)-lysidine synthase
MSLAARVQAFAARHALWSPGTRVAAAVSGGSDSVALLFILRELADAGAFGLAGLAHLHHHIRGEEADGDAAFCEALARRLRTRADIGHADVPALSRARRESIEVAARHARLAFFEEAIGRLEADVIALAHTRRDQAETVLLRLARGAGPRGLGAMAPRNGHRIRPLLDVPRDHLRAFLRDRGETWREDSTNEDRSTARNWVRQEVMPRLSVVNPRVERAVARAARIQAEDAALLDSLASEAAGRIVRRDDQSVRLDALELGSLPEALARRVLLKAFETLGASRSYGWEETEAALQALRDGRDWDLPGLRMERIRRDAVLTIRGPQPPQSFAGVQPTPLPVPGTARDPAGRWVIEAHGPMAPGAAGPLHGIFVVLDAAVVGKHLMIRGRRPGDRIEPPGLGGRKKVQDLFVDRKVPRDERDLVPLVVDEQDRIVWIPGHAVGRAFGAGPQSAAVVVLILRR